MNLLCLIGGTLLKWDYTSSTATLGIAKTAQFGTLMLWAGTAQTCTQFSQSIDF